MNKLNINKAGLVLGSLLGLLHACWSLLIAIGWAQPLIDFIFRVHMIEPVFTVSSFDFGTAATLVVVTFVIGYVVGSLFAYLWNRFHGK